MSFLHVRFGFMTDPECEKLAESYFKIAKSVYEDHETAHFVMNLDDFMQKSAGFETDLLTEARESVRDEVESAFSERDLHILSTAFVEMRAGAALPLRPGPDPDPHVEYRAFVYLNECGKDYEGGLLYFDGLSTWPPMATGTLVAHPCVDGFEHRIGQVTAGRRLGLSFLLTRAQELAENLC